MGLKKILPIIVIIAMMSITLVGMHPVSAATTEIKAFGYDYLARGYITELGTDYTMKRGEEFNVAAALYADDIGPRMLRYIQLDVYNSNSELVYTKTPLAFEFAIYQYFKPKNLFSGDYKMVFTYEGNKGENWPKARKIVNLHVIP